MKRLYANMQKYISIPWTVYSVRSAHPESIFLTNICILPISEENARFWPHRRFKVTDR